MTDPLPRAADAEHLTEPLRRSGAVGAARVSHAAVMSAQKKLRSHTWRLRLDYEGRAEDGPGSVILKTGHRDGAGRPATTNDREIAFYRDVAPALPARLERSAPRCFDR
ncbi:hypothetical protein [Taklimakanibacter deserti]|uniref:hypothetical protein n=1 Tax=Taklimakanibacter deserti TaxID=2267839 RepID=UPI000E65DC5E